MKINKLHTATSLLALALLSGVAKAETAADIGTLPSQKVPASVDERDRNPFSTRISVQEDRIGEFDGDSEESRIRQIFAGLAVSGRVPASQGSPRVLVGDLILKEGGEVPQVIENQTDVLKVTRIDDKEVELTWVDEELAAAPRKLLIPINLEPAVSFILPGRGGGSGGQFVTMEKPNEKNGSDKEKSASGTGDPLVDEDEAGSEDEREKQDAPAKQKSVSPFGLFRR